MMLESGTGCDSHSFGGLAVLAMTWYLFVNWICIINNSSLECFASFTSIMVHH